MTSNEANRSAGSEFELGTARDDALRLLKSLSHDALAAVQSAILITDPGQPDNPIVYVNPAFCTMTGYDENEILGRICRFLQGTESDQQAVASIREAIDAERPVREVLANYRKDGSLFYNEICINPIRNSAGTVTHFVGCQNVVASPDKARVQVRANELLQTLSRREREVFDGLVQGLSVKAIALMYDLSPRTVEKHRYRMQKKLGTVSLAILVRIAIAAGDAFNDFGQEEDTSDQV